MIHVYSTNDACRLVIIHYNHHRGPPRLFISFLLFFLPSFHPHRFHHPIMAEHRPRIPALEVSHTIIIIITMLDRILTILPSTCAIATITFQGTKGLVNRYQCIRPILQGSSRSGPFLPPATLFDLFNLSINVNRSIPPSTTNTGSCFAVSGWAHSKRSNSKLALTLMGKSSEKETEKRTTARTEEKGKAPHCSCHCVIMSYCSPVWLQESIDWAYGCISMFGLTLFALFFVKGNYLYCHHHHQ